MRYFHSHAAFLFTALFSLQTFGKVPQYLKQFQRARQEEEEKWEEDKRMERERLENMKLSPEERDNILDVRKVEVLKRSFKLFIYV